MEELARLTERLQLSKQKNGPTWIRWSLLTQGFAFCSFRYWGQPCLGTDDSPSDGQVHSSLTLHHGAYITHLTSSHHIDNLSSHIIIRGWGRYIKISWERERERDHIHINFITEYCYNCFILLLVILNLLLCLICTLYFMIGMYVQEKTWNIQSQHKPQFQSSTGDLGRTYTLWIRGATVLSTYLWKKI